MAPRLYVMKDLRKSYRRRGDLRGSGLFLSRRQDSYSAHGAGKSTARLMGRLTDFRAKHGARGTRIGTVAASEKTAKKVRENVEEAVTPGILKKFEEIA